MNTLHVVPGLDEPTNGIAVAARAIARAQRLAGDNADLVETRGFLAPAFACGACDEIWVHSMWLPATLCACCKALCARAAHGVRFVRMTHGCLDPVKLAYHAWKKLPVLPLERLLLNRADRVMATEDAEADWIRRLAPRVPIGRIDLGASVSFTPRPGLGQTRFLFIGRLHPLKGLDILLAALRELHETNALPRDFTLTVIGRDEKNMKRNFVRMAAGLPVRFLGEVDEATKRRELGLADALVLPTLSENFGLVVMEALACGTPVITTDGASVWKGHAGVRYLEGFVAADALQRVAMLKSALFSGRPADVACSPAVELNRNE